MTYTGTCKVSKCLKQIVWNLNKGWVKVKKKPQTPGKHSNFRFSLDMLRSKWFQPKWSVAIDSLIRQQPIRENRTLDI